MPKYFDLKNSLPAIRNNTINFLDLSSTVVNDYSDLLSRTHNPMFSSVATSLTVLSDLPPIW